MTSVKKKDIEHGQEHGEIQNLGSPILSKLQQAFLYIRTLSIGTAHEDFSSHRSIEGNFRPGQLPMLAFFSSAAYVPLYAVGNRCGAVHVAWNKDEARLVLFFKVSLTAQLVPRSASGAAAQCTASCCDDFVI